jgi:3-hydroxybutyryl-CoA dehydratase
MPSFGRLEVNACAGPMLSDLFPVGTTATYRTRLSVEMLRDFGDLVGDRDRIHFDEQFSKSTPYGRPIAHGVLLLGFMSAASTQATQNSNIPLVSLGYDRVRFIGPAFPGEKIVARFVVTGHDDPRGRILADVEARSDGRLVAVASNILKSVGSSAEPSGALSRVTRTAF